jgi:hypothetical protein
MSHKPYAVDLSRLREGSHGFFYVDAVWFRRRRRGGFGPGGTVVTVACVGNLHAIQRPAPATAREFIERYTDGRRGGDCEGRWDGTGYWGAEEPDVQAKHLDLLRPMLDGYTADPKNPALPAPFEGWWTFQ